MPDVAQLLAAKGADVNAKVYGGVDVVWGGTSGGSVAPRRWVGAVTRVLALNCGGV